MTDSRFGDSVEAGAEQKSADAGESQVWSDSRAAAPAPSESRNEDSVRVAAERVVRIYRGLANDENDGEFAIWSEPEFINAIVRLDSALLAAMPDAAQSGVWLARLREVARDCGYAVAVHGSQKRDLDLIAVPWMVEAVSAQQLVDTLCEVMSLHSRAINFYGDELPWRMEPNPEMKPWGRLAWALDGVPGSTVEWKYVDLSVAPRAGEAVPASIAQGYRTAEREYLIRRTRAKDYADDLMEALRDD